MPPRPQRQEGTQARCSGGLAGEQAQRDGSQSQRNRPWTEDEEVQLAVLLLQHGTSWTRVAAGLDGRSANAARCKVRNDIRAARTAYRHKRREYGRLLFRLAYRMEEQGLRLEQLRPTDLVAELSPIDHPRIHAAYCKTKALPQTDMESNRLASLPVCGPVHEDQDTPAWGLVSDSESIEQGYDDAAYRLMFLMGY